MTLPLASSSFVLESLLLNLLKLDFWNKIFRANSKKPKSPVQQKVENHYDLTISYRTYHLTHRNLLYDYAVLRSIKKLVKKVKLLMNAHSFDLKILISFSGF